MYGAILGDIIGSPFEFDRGKQTKDFELFSKGCTFTDDTIMTVAVAEALLTAERDSTVADIETLVTYFMQGWGRNYLYAGGLSGCYYRIQKLYYLSGRLYPY